MLETIRLVPIEIIIALASTFLTLILGVVAAINYNSIEASGAACLVSIFTCWYCSALPTATETLISFVLFAFAGICLYFTEK